MTIRKTIDDFFASIQKLKMDEPLSDQTLKARDRGVIALVSLGARSQVEQKLLEGWDANATSGGTSAALRAAERNDLKMLRLLIDNGASVHIQDMSGCSPLTYARIHKNKK